LPLGDLVEFCSLRIHRGGPNLTATPRYALFFATPMNAAADEALYTDAAVMQKDTINAQIDKY
jgi:hypothetical protein